MAPDPIGQRQLNRKAPVKWAILMVLSTRCWLSVADIVVLFKELSYRRSKTSIRDGLQRIVAFGLAVVQKDPENKSTNQWAMTERGRQLVCAQPSNDKIMQETVSNKVRGQMAIAEKWLCISDLFTILKTVNPSTISRALRKERGLYKSKLIPGDIKHRKQWAMAVADTDNWNNATPVDIVWNKKPKAKKSKKATKPQTQLALPATTSPQVPPGYAIAIYEGFTMCLPVNKPTLVNAVGEVVLKEFLPGRAKFSAHEVTERLRAIVLEQRVIMGNSPNLNFIVNPDENGTVFVKGHKVPKIDHEDVKAIVHEFFHIGAMKGFGRLHNGQFFEYDLVENLPATAQVVDDDIHVS